MTNMTTFGIALDTWADIDGACSMSYCEVTRSNVQIMLGHETGSLHLVMTERSLVALVDVAGKALQAMQTATR